jgi:hypothetical protein
MVQLGIAGNGINLDLFPEIILLRDKSGYSIGPHTDAPARLMSFFFYLPDDDNHPELGTSVYKPTDPNFICEGGPHHGFEGFEMVERARYVRNSSFGFLKTNNSFHGVPPIDETGIIRDSICCIIKHKKK